MSEPAGATVPQEFIELYERYVREGRTGNVALDIKNGQVMGCRANEYVKLGTSAGEHA